MIMLKIWGRASSLSVQRVMWLVDELGLPYEMVPAGGSFGGLDRTEFRRMNPQGRIPVIVDGGEPIWESHTILRYLAARHETAGFWIASPAARAGMEKWMDWSLATLQPALMGGVFRGLVRTPAPQRNENLLREALDRTVAGMRILDAALEERSYLCGDVLSLADIAIGCMLFRYYTMPIEQPDLPHLRNWYDRLRERPAYRRHVMVPYDDLWGAGG